MALDKRPESRPHAADTRHAFDVEDEETFVVVLGALETNTLPAGPTLVIESLGRVHTEDHIVTAGRVETTGHSRSLIDIVYKSVVEIIGLELKGIEPVPASEALLLLVSGSDGGRRESRQDGANAQNE
jgi:hypothetical protein